MTEMFDIYAIFPPLDFKESAEFNKNKDWKDISGFTQPFADIFRVQKRPTLYCDFRTGCAITQQSLQGFIALGLV